MRHVFLSLSLVVSLLLVTPLISHAAGGGKPPAKKVTANSRDSIRSRRTIASRRPSAPRRPAPGHVQRMHQRVDAARRGSQTRVTETNERSQSAQRAKQTTRVASSGGRIHLAQPAGRHLPHEALHVVSQRASYMSSRSSVSSVSAMQRRSVQSLRSVEFREAIDMASVRVHKHSPTP